MPEREVWVLVGDGSYLMMNSEIATSVMLDKKLNIVVLDNGGFGCIERLQRSCGGASFNNLFPGGSCVRSILHCGHDHPPICTMVLDAGTKSGSPIWCRSSFLATTSRM